MKLNLTYTDNLRKEKRKEFWIGFAILAGFVLLALASGL